MKYFYTFYKRIFFLILIYFSSRILFYLYNSTYFSSCIFLSIFEGIRFDISALFYINIPLLILLLFPTNFRGNKWYKKTTNIIFYVVNVPFIMINNADIEYFKFSQKRTTADFFEYISLDGGNDAFQLIPKYIIDFPHVSIIIVIQLILLFRIKDIPSEKIKNVFLSIVLFSLSVGIFVLGARGGLQLKPIKTIDAAVWSNSENSSLVLNSPFCILHTLLDNELKKVNYFSENEMDSIYNCKHQFSGEFQNKNVVIIILESFSKEFVGYYNNGKGYTPFLDSLIPHSLVMENAYSNGIKSIEALPAITASIPTLMNDPFITSSYANNKYKSLTNILKNEGYTSSFFHGGTRGTMGFYQFSKKAGFDSYFGMEEYGNMNDHDGSWGIYDEPFLEYFSEHLGKEKQPFICSFFSLTSHPPYNIPENLENKFPKGELQIHESVGYTDYALKQFFEKSKDEEWFKNTLFIITADHTSPESSNKKYNSKIGRYSIPIIYFMGDSSLKSSDSVITQQIDILPTTLDILNYNKTFYSFGNSIYEKKNWAISYLSNQYILINEDGFLLERNGVVNNFSDSKLKIKSEVKKEKKDFLNAIIQRYNNSLIENKMTNEN